ncbi:hypothetical protein [Pyrobaculum aerophilum]|nr:hypothetical protein [Pyrobaculum aerophilum]
MANAKTLWFAAAVVATNNCRGIGSVSHTNASPNPHYTPHYAFSNADYA